MTRDRWHAVEEVFHAALDRDPAARSAFLASACGDDDALRAEVQSLLDAAESQPGVLDAGAMQLVGSSVPIAMTGTRLGAYEVGSLLGSGGMGDVYRARDARLGRDVAIKVVRPEFTRDAERLARFDREARVLASLNHRNVAAIYGVEEHATGRDRSRALVMELVEGETLAERLRRTGPLRVRDALLVAEQIAAALDAAHAKGIVHRDLKPANVKLTSDGTVKVLDFGLAVITTERGTDVAQCTMHGAILGTVAYMSPEQARGAVVDKRTDIWAFGCVLFEMLTGRAAFGRATVPDTLVAVLDLEPDWASIPPATPPAITKLLRRCLAKDEAARLRDIGDARLDVADALAASSLPAAATDPAPRRPWTTIAGWAATAIAGAAIGVGVAWWAFAGVAAPRPEQTRFEFTTPSTSAPASLALSPDGRNVAFVADRNGSSLVWVRNLGEASSRPLDGTDGGTLPFWSPDGRTLGFFAAGKLRRIDIDGGTAQTLADAPNPHGGAWADDNTIIFSPHQLSPLMGVPAAGGDLRAITRLVTGHLGHAFPQLLAGGDRLLYFALGSAESNGVHVSRVDGSNARRLPGIGSPAVYSTTGHLLFVRNDALVAQPFDVESGEMAGPAAPVSTGIVQDPAPAVYLPAVVTSPSGTIAFRGQPSGNGRQLTWFGRDGRVLSRVGAVDGSRFQSVVNLSPDGRRVAVTRDADGNRDVWLIDLERAGAMSRVTSYPEHDGTPTWGPDGSVLFSRMVAPLSIFRRRPQGASDELVLRTQQNSAPVSVSPDGKTLLYLRADSVTLLDIWLLPLEPIGESHPLVRTPSEDTNASFDASGRWVAYQSLASGRYEVYAVRADGAGPAIQISTNGGTQPRWGGNGRELFFISFDQQMMAVPIRHLPGSPFLEAGLPSPLFRAPIGGPSLVPRQYDVTRDGQRFLVDVPVEGASTPLTLIQHWRP